MAKLFVPLIKRSVSKHFEAIFGKLNFWLKFDRRWPYKNSEILYTLKFVLRKYFLAKLFVPLIKRSVSKQFEAIFGKLIFWRKFNRSGPYKNSEILYYLKLLLENIFWLNYMFPSSKEVFLHNFRQFLENWFFDGNSTGADLKLLLENIFWLNYMFPSSKEVLQSNLRQFLEIWFFDGNSTGADFTKIVKFCTALNCAKEIFFG